MDYKQMFDVKPRMSDSDLARKVRQMEAPKRRRAVFSPVTAVAAAAVCAAVGLTVFYRDAPEGSSDPGESVNVAASESTAGVESTQSPQSETPNAGGESTQPPNAETPNENDRAIAGFALKPGKYMNVSGDPRQYIEVYPDKTLQIFGFDSASSDIAELYMSRFAFIIKEREDNGVFYIVAQDENSQAFASAVWIDDNGTIGIRIGDQSYRYAE